MIRIHEWTYGKVNKYLNKEIHTGLLCEALKWFCGDDASETTPQLNELGEAVSVKKRNTHLGQEKLLLTVQT